MDVNFVAVARPPNAMDTVGWRTWTPGLPQINTKNNGILTPVVCIDASVEKSLQNIMEINGFEFGMCLGDVTNCCFSVLQYVAHTPNGFEHVVSFRFGIQATFGPYVSLPFALQAALGHETTVCVTFGARRRNTYFCRCHGDSTIACFTSILGASFLPTRFPMWFGAHSATVALRMPNLPASLDS